MQMRWVIVITIWSAPAERSVDGTFPVSWFSVRGSQLVGFGETGHGEPKHPEPFESGVALRLPPQSKLGQALGLLWRLVFCILPGQAARPLGQGNGVHRRHILSFC